jgi:hypothetical protein
MGRRVDHKRIHSFSKGDETLVYATERVHGAGFSCIGASDHGQAILDGSEFGIREVLHGCRAAPEPRVIG